MKKKTKRLLIFLSAAILLNVIMNICGNALITEYYSISTDKLTEPVRIVFISDLHNCTYGGSDQSRIMERIQSEQPDLILFGGDVIDFQGGTKHTLRLMEFAKDCAPCAYAAGNHEGMRKDTQSFYSDVDQLGIPILNGAYTDITLKGQKIRICGIVDAIGYPNQLETVCQAPDSNSYRILLAHQPEQLNTITEEAQKYGFSFDLVLAGHAHGGQWRIPKLLEQGLYAPDQGILPEFTGGIREIGTTVQIVSRGLAKPLRMILIPRIFNRPELSVIDILPDS